jgi:hypothetical protein
MKRISKIHIIAGCSPEGSYSFNQRLSKNRVLSIRNVLADYITLPDSVVVEKAIGINWQGLRDMVEADPNVPHRQRVLEIIDNSPELAINYLGDEVELRKQRLVWLHDGEAWQYMYDKFFPTLRSFNLQIAIEWEMYKAVAQEVEKSIGGGNLIECQLDTLATPQLQAIPDITSIPPLFTPSLPPFYMGVKSNLLYDLALVPNIGVEFYLGKNLSLTANYMHAWWHNDNIHWYWRVYGADMGLRYWFGKEAAAKPLTGHHVGAYIQALTYDIELGNMGIIGGEPGGDIFDQPNFTAAIEYGYSLPIAPRLNLDFTLGVGYHWGIFYEYLPIDDCYVWQATKKRNYVGPTKAEVSLVWLIGRGNVNSTKGGAR